MSRTPTVLLVHGAFADAGSWSGVIAELQNHGIPVVAPPNPLRGLASDAAYVASVAAQIDGPVVLVGHSYGGALITVAGTAENVVGLVYVAALRPRRGREPGRVAGPLPAAPARQQPRRVDVPRRGRRARGRGHASRPDAFPEHLRRGRPGRRHQDPRRRPNARWPPSAFAEQASAAAWRTKPSWALVAGADEAINPDVERFGAKRAGATVVEIDGASHAVAVSRPEEVAAADPGRGTSDELTSRQRRRPRPMPPGGAAPRSGARGTARPATTDPRPPHPPGTPLALH